MLDNIGLREREVSARKLFPNATRVLAYPHTEKHAVVEVWTGDTARVFAWPTVDAPANARLLAEAA